jgi:hypothetical protein
MASHWLMHGAEEKPAPAPPLLIKKHRMSALFSPVKLSLLHGAGILAKIYHLVI